jgi:polysaccharide biosynthesis protein PslJ
MEGSMTSTVYAHDELLSVPTEPQKKRDTVSYLSLYLLLLIVIPSDLVFSPLGGAGEPANILGVVFLAVYLFRLLNPMIRFNPGRLLIRSAAIFFLLAFLASYAAANFHSLDTLAQNAVDRGLVSIAGWLGVLLICADCINDLGDLKKLLDRLVLGGTFLAILGGIQFATSIDLAGYISIPGLAVNAPYTDDISRGSFSRPQATTAHPLEFAFVIAVILPIAIHLARYAPKEQRRRRWMQVALIAISLPLTVSRSAFIGLAVAAIVILPVWAARERLVALGIIAVSLLGLEAVVPGLLHTIENLFLAIGSDSSTTSRTSALSNSISVIAQHPIFGIGFGTFAPQIYFYTDDQYLNSAIGLGLVGVSAQLALYITGFVTARRARRVSPDPEIQHLAQCMAASCGIVLCVSATFDALSFAMATGLTFFMLGCVGALYRNVTSGSSLGAQIPSPPVLDTGRRS